MAGRIIVLESSKSRMPAYTNNGVSFIPSSQAAGAMGSRRVDSVLIRRAQQGDTTAFEELVRLYDRSVLRLAVHLTGSQEDGQDIYQEVFLRAYINLARFRFECSFYTWTYRIVTNLCLDHLRKKNSRGLDVTTTVSPDGEEEEVLNRMPDHRPGASPERSLVGRELRRCILRALGSLSPRERMIFELK